jgi:hypothetical protein
MGHRQTATSKQRNKRMSPLPEFATQLMIVVAGVVLTVMTAAFLLLPYSMSAHPGEMPAHQVAGSYHPT